MHNLPLSGRIAVISGIFGGLRTPSTNDRGWRIAFIAGLIAAALAASLVTGATLPSPAMPASMVLIVVPGLLVGFGSRVGSGYTSGHGVCGIARLSTRSLIGTAVFIIIIAAVAAVAIARHII